MHLLTVYRLAIIDLARCTFVHGSQKNNLIFLELKVNKYIILVHVP